MFENRTMLQDIKSEVLHTTALEIYKTLGNDAEWALTDVSSAIEGYKGKLCYDELRDIHTFLTQQTWPEQENQPKNPIL
jgi:hypothetical protein